MPTEANANNAPTPELLKEFLSTLQGKQEAKIPEKIEQIYDSVFSELEKNEQYASDPNKFIEALKEKLPPALESTGWSVGEIKLSAENTVDLVFFPPPINVDNLKVAFVVNDTVKINSEKLVAE